MSIEDTAEIAAIAKVATQVKNVKMLVFQERSEVHTRPLASQFSHHNFAEKKRITENDVSCIIHQGSAEDAPCAFCAMRRPLVR